MQAQSIIVIHPGSLYLRIGRASDLNPHTELHAIARRRLVPGAIHRDTILPPVVPKLKDIEADLDTIRLQLSHTLQSCLMTDGSRRYATPPQQISAFNKRSSPDNVQDSSSSHCATPLSSVSTVIAPDWIIIETDIVVGDEMPMKRGDLNVHSGVGGSLTAVLADLETIWSWVIVNRLKIPMHELKNYRAVLIIGDIYNRHYLKELTGLLLGMGFSSCFLLQDHVAATFGAGVGAACVVDCGHAKTSVSCVEDGISQPATRVRLPYGGGDITQTLKWLLNKCSFPYKRCDPDSNPLDALLLERLKHDVCHVDLDVCGSLEKSFIIRQPKIPVVKYTIQVADECMIAPLGVFQPELFAITGATRQPIVTQKRSSGDSSDPHDADYLRETGVSPLIELEKYLEVSGSGVDSTAEFTPGGQLLGLDQAVLQSIARCGSDDLKRKMYSCILVVGGGMKFKGISTWLQNKIALQIPYIFRAEQMDIVTWPKEMDPVMTAWKGAAIMACLESAHELWITPEEWLRYSVRVLRERAPFIW
ncbi:hypothetical protein AAG570_013492 [Ranatra chinensis]|uniref:Actin-related protein 8 n=1 Tax=Ranatra chinensis TaxID=642074 RepID=A0ABD0YCB9_9HEMI